MYFSHATSFEHFKSIIDSGKILTREEQIIAHGQEIESGIFGCHWAKKRSLKTMFTEGYVGQYPGIYFRPFISSTVHDGDECIVLVLSDKVLKIREDWHITKDDQSGFYKDRFDNDWELNYSEFISSSEVTAESELVFHSFIPLDQITAIKVHSERTRDNIVYLGFPREKIFLPDEEITECELVFDWKGLPKAEGKYRKRSILYHLAKRFIPHYESWWMHEDRFLVK